MCMFTFKDEHEDCSVVMHVGYMQKELKAFVKS